VATLAHEGTIVGIKDSSRDFEYFQGVCIATRDLPRFRIFTGSDTMLLPALAMGGAGTICGAANVAPGWIVRIYEDFRRNDMDAARAGQDKLYQLVMVLRGGVFPAAIKAACHVRNLRALVRSAGCPLDDQARAKLRPAAGVGTAYARRAIVIRHTAILVPT
jgi:4-hydroxy-tetrahydrodipicolinate synthase